MRRRACLIGAILAGTTVPALADGPIVKGAFAGASGHVTKGTVEITETNGALFVSLGDGFALDGGPDPQVAVGNKGDTPTAILGDLSELSGAQNYPIPAGVDPAGITKVWIWCTEFSVPLGVAELR